jgi:hypothetical protein
MHGAKAARGVGLALALVGGWLGCGIAEQPEELALTDEQTWAEEAAEPESEVSAEWNRPSSSCQGVVPAEPGPGRLVSRSHEGGGCMEGTSDGRGSLALGVFKPLYDAADWAIFTPEGTPLNTIYGGVLNVMMPQRSGFHVAIDRFGSRDLRLVSFSHQGEQRDETVLIPEYGGRWSAVNDLQGGSVVSWVRAGATGDIWEVMVQRFNSSGQPRTPPLQVQTGWGEPPRYVVVGADTEGRVLVLWTEPAGEEDYNLRGRWLRRNETFTSAFIVAAGVPEAFYPYSGDGRDVLSPLIGGGLALKVASEWVAFIPSKKTFTRPAPGWLRAYVDSSLYIVRGGSAYAVVSDDPAAQERLWLLAPAGNLCGERTLPAEELRALEIGREGTVIGLQLPVGEEECTYRYWPGLLR